MHSMTVKKSMLAISFFGLLSIQKAHTHQEGFPLPPSETETFELPTITAHVADTYSGGQLARSSRLGFLGNIDVRDAPFSISSYTEKRIKDTDARDISDVIAKTDPSVHAAKFTAGSPLEDYNIRGFRSSIYDVSMNGLYGIAPFYRSSPEMFDQIQVLKGPSTMLNGMPPYGSVGGHVNLVTKRATAEPINSISADWRSDSIFGTHLDFGRRFGENNAFGIRLNAMVRGGDTRIEHQETETQLYSIGFDYQGERFRSSLDAYASKEKIDGVSRGVTLAPGVLTLPSVPKNSKLINPPWTFNDVEDKGIMGRIEFDLTQNTTLYATAGISSHDIKAYNAGQVTVDSNGFMNTTIGAVGDEVTRRSGEIGIQSSFNTGPVSHHLVANISSYNEHNHLIGNRYRWVDRTNIYNPQWRSDVPAYSVEPYWKTKTDIINYGIANTFGFIDDSLLLTLGLRHSRINTDQILTGRINLPTDHYKSNATTPSIAVNYRINDRISVYANYIEGLSKGAVAPFNAINYGEVFSPYKTKQIEAGLKFDLLGFDNTVSVFQIKKKDGYLDPYTNYFVADGEQRNRGIEWTFIGEPIDGLRFLGGIAILDAEITNSANKLIKGKNATGVPDWQGKLGVEWDASFVHGLTLSANVTHVAKQYIDPMNQVKIPSYTLLDFGARYKAKVGNNKYLTVRASVDNVTNKAYWEKPYYGALAIGSPRTFRISTTYEF
ncbi:Ferric-anguibactin receptor FatA [Oligella urethralis]|nr:MULTISPECIES: TonB-dependent siderophore receptor [Oligella]OFV48252.1 hypothetical protein HMPREF3179_06630 [Oligella sp. HMSC09E12]PMC16808.1 TonB-dependent siderophore receptor [Oligella urethralis]WOS36820.1 Ferric-anguibactin receptor FatA [Oligella urethralis]